MEIEVYVDVLFALNYLIDMQILFLTAILSRQKLKLWRLTVGTGLLALYGTVIFYPEIWALYTIFGRVIISAVGVLVLCGPKSLAAFGKSYVIFWLVSAGMGGAVTALAMGTDFGRVLGAIVVNGSLYLDMGLWTLFAGIALSYGLIIGFQKICIRNFSRDKILVKLLFRVGEQCFAVTGLVDTGCELTMPVTGDGMILIPRSVLGNAAPRESLSVPIHTAGGKGEIEAFYPEEIICGDSRYELTGTPAIGIAEEAFAADGLYHAIINPDILRENKINGGRKHEVESQNTNGTLAAKLGGKIRMEAKERRVLHRRKRDAAAAIEPGRRSGVTDSPGQSRNPAGGPADTDRTEFAAGGIHCEKV